MIMRISFMCNIKFFFIFFEPTSLICFRQRSCLTPTRIKQQLKKQLDPSLVDCLKQEYRFRPVLHLRKNTVVSTLLLFSQCNKKKCSEHCHICVCAKCFYQIFKGITIEAFENTADS